MKLRRLLIIILTPFLLTACDFIDDIFNIFQQEVPHIKKCCLMATSIGGG